MIASRRFPLVLGEIVLALGLIALPISSSRASGEGCPLDLKLDLGGSLDCENIAALAPSNDTRVNLLLLLRDRFGGTEPSKPVDTPVLEWFDFRDRYATKPEDKVRGFVSGEGSRCRSNDTGVGAFEAEVAGAKDLPPEERTALLAARKGLTVDCATNGKANPAVADALQNVRSTTGKAFATYLHGVDAFYAGRFDDASKDFDGLKDGGDTWLADSAAYMVARTRLNQLQVDAFDEYGSFAGSDHINQQAAVRTDEALSAYLKAHPKGRYVVSAQGLLRRVAWLAGWTDKLATYYAALLATPASARTISDVALADEIDGKLLPTLKPGMTKDPLLLAVLDLKAMRKLQGKQDGAGLSPADVESQRDAFASLPALHDFLAAASAFYASGATAPVIKGVPDDTRRRDGDNLWFSRQLLRGMALEAAHDRNTRGFWKELYPATSRPLEQSTIELALALYEEKQGKLKDIFAPGSLVKNPDMRIVLLEHVAGPALLRAQAQDGSTSKRERNHALAALLYKELTRGQYADFLTDLRSAPPAAAAVVGAKESEAVDDAGLQRFTAGESAGDIACPVLTATATHLAADATSIRDRLCLAEFVRLNQLDDNRIDTPMPDDQLGSTPSLFPGKPYGRAFTYQAIIRDKAAPPADRAYALYRAVKCYEPTGINACGGPEIPKVDRKAWYFALKRDYPGTDWAKELRYWW